jgi:hypothetical protein
MTRTGRLLLLAVAAAPLGAQGAAGTYGQELVERTVTRHPEALVVALYATPPKASGNVTVAANDGSTGKPPDETVLQVIRSGKPHFGPAGSGDRFDADVVLQDVSKRPIGALRIRFAWHKGSDRAGLRRKAEAIRNELRRRIAHLANLMDAYPVDASIPQRTFAQHLVDQALDRNPGILIVAIHAATPTNKDYPIIASNIGRIGKKADDDDMEVITTAKPRLEINESGDRFESEGALRNSSGQVIGAVGVVFPYQPGDDQQALHAKAEALRATWSRQLPNASRLLDTYP